MIVDDIRAALQQHALGHAKALVAARVERLYLPWW